MPIRTSNRRCKQYVNEKTPFKANHIFAENQGRFYVVYSWGRHFPMYIYDFRNRQWFANKDRYSQSTSVHQSQARPSGDVVYLSTEEMKELLDKAEDTEFKDIWGIKKKPNLWDFKGGY